MDRTKTRHRATVSKAGVASDADSAPDVEMMAASLRMSIARLARLLRQQDHSDLSPALATALASVWRHGPLTLSRLAALEQVTPPTVSKLVDKLEKRGLINRTADPADGRVCRVTVTPAGVDRLDEIRSRRTEWLSAQLRGLPADDLARLHNVIDVLDHLVTAPEAVPMVDESMP